MVEPDSIISRIIGNTEVEYSYSVIKLVKYRFLLSAENACWWYAIEI
jgi:hypothetical protein